MNIQSLDIKRFGWFCEGMIVSLLPENPIWLSKQRRDAGFDILWKDISIEVKGTKGSIKNNRYYFSRSNLHMKKIPDIYVLIAWNNADVRIWVVSGKKVQNTKDSICVQTNISKWIKNEIIDFKDLQNVIRKELL